MEVIQRLVHVELERVLVLLPVFLVVYLEFLELGSLDSRVLGYVLEVAEVVFEVLDFIVEPAVLPEVAEKLLCGVVGARLALLCHILLDFYIDELDGLLFLLNLRGDCLHLLEVFVQAHLLQLFDYHVELLRDLVGGLHA